MRSKKTIVLVFLLLFLVAALLPSSVFAAAQDWTVVSEYNINENGRASVQHIFEITNNDATATPKSIEVSIFGKDIRGVQAETQDSASITATLSQDSKSIKLDLPDYSGQSRKWSFTVNYDSDVLSSFGDSKLVLLEPLSLGDSVNVLQHDVSVSVDLSLGFAVARGRDSIKSQVGIGSQILTYRQQGGLIPEGLQFYFGETSTAAANFETNLKNDSWWWQTKRLVLPPDTNQQRVVLESITPQPTKLQLDTDGNIIAEYSLSPKREITVSAQVKISTSGLTYGFEKGNTFADFDRRLVEQYTPATDAWQPSDIEIKESERTTVVKAVEALFKKVSASLNEQSKADFNLSERLGSIAAADQLVGALRGYGIPARVVVGKVASNGITVFDQLTDAAWAEAYLPGTGWITLDPVLESNVSSFGTSDVTHIGLALWGVEDDFPPIDLSIWNVSYETGKLEEVPPSTLEVSVNKSVFFPGLSLQTVSINMPAGQIVDGAAVQDESGNLVEFGSLAPFQQAAVRSLAFGAAAFSSQSYQAGIINGANFDTIGAAITSTTSYVPLLILVLIIGAISGAIFWWRRRRDSNNHRRSKSTFIMHEENSGGDIEEQDLMQQSVLTPIEEPAEEAVEAALDPVENMAEPVESHHVKSIEVERPTPRENNDTIKSSNHRGDDSKPPLIQG